MRFTDIACVYPGERKWGGGVPQMRTSESQYAAEALKKTFPREPAWITGRPLLVTGSVITAKQSFSHHISFTPPWRSYCTPTLLRPARSILHLFWAPLLRVQLKVTVMWGRKHFPSNIRFSQGSRRENVQISHNLMFFYMIDLISVLTFEGPFSRRVGVVGRVNMTSHSGPTSRAVTLKSLSSVLSTFN